MDNIHEKNGNILYILNVLKKYSDEEHKLSAKEIQEKIKKIYNVDIDSRTIRRNIIVLKEKLNYDICTYTENGKGYYITNNPETDFEPGEIRAIIDTFSYSDYIVTDVAENIIKKCKNLQTVYENNKLKNYKIYCKDSKTNNKEVIKNIEDIADSIRNLNKISFEYWKYEFDEKLVKTIVSKPKVTPYALVYNEQQYYMIGIKEGQQDFYYYRLDRIKNIKQLEEKREISKTSSEIQKFAESTIEMFGGRIEEIEASCDKKMINPIIDKFGKNIKIEKIDDNNLKITLNTDRIGFLYWALKNIKDVEVLKPLDLRNEIKEIINDSKIKYEN